MNMFNSSVNRKSGHGYYDSAYIPLITDDDSLKDAAITIADWSDIDDKLLNYRQKYIAGVELKITNTDYNAAALNSYAYIIPSVEGTK